MQEQEDSEVGIGILFAERYLIQRSLGTGGMGSVYLAADQLLDGTEVALKVLHKELTADQKQLQRFFREVQVTRQITHRNIVRTFDAGQSVGRVFFTMEYVPGVVLKDILNEYRLLDISQTVPILSDIAQGLSAIHAQGVIHRDLKPANIILAKDGVARITDFGVARPSTSELTHHSEVVGSTAYLSPEAWTGRDVNHRTDLYALGVVAYEMLTGKKPFEAGSPAEYMFKHLEQQPASIRSLVPELPAWIDHLVLQLLAKDQYERPESADEIVSRLADGLGYDEYTAVPETEEPSRTMPAKDSHITGIRSVDNLARKKRIKDVEAALRSRITSQDVDEEELALLVSSGEHDTSGLPDLFELPVVEASSEYLEEEVETMLDSPEDSLEDNAERRRSSVQVKPASRVSAIATSLLLCGTLPTLIHYLLPIGWDAVESIPGNGGWVAQFLASTIVVMIVAAAMCLPFAVCRAVTAHSIIGLKSWSLSIASLSIKIALLFFGGITTYKVHLLTSGGKESTFITALGGLSVQAMEATTQFLFSVMTFSLLGPGIAILESNGVVRIAETNSPGVSYSFAVALLTAVFAAGFSLRTFRIGTYGMAVPIAIAGCFAGFDLALRVLDPAAFNEWMFSFSYAIGTYSMSVLQLLLAVPKWLLFLFVLKRFSEHRG